MIERFLARLYTDAALRRAFLANPLQVALENGLDVRTAKLLEHIDREGLELAAASFESRRKRFSGDRTK